MSISVSMGSLVNRLMAENAVESDESNRLIRKAGYDQAQSTLAARNSERKIAQDLESAAGWVQVGSSIASTIQSGVKVGQAASEARQYMAVEPGLTDATTRAGQGDEAAFEKVLDTRLGDPGMTVRERFGEAGARALIDPEIAVRNDESRAGWDDRVGARLEALGFTEDEIDDIHRAAKDGELSAEEAVELMWSHRKDPAKARAQERLEASIEQLQEQIVKLTSEGASMAAESSQATSEALDELSEDLGGVAAEAHEQAVAHNEAVGELSLQALRERRGLARADA